MPRKTATERFWEKVDKRGPDECWPWQACRHKYGYGQFNVTGKRGGRYCRAHVFALEEKLGRRLKSGMCGLHSCDNPPCCNPDHLWEGTHVDNVRDRDAKGRTAIIIDDEIVRQARLRRQSGESFSEIAAALGIGKTTAFRYVRQPSKGGRRLVS